MILHIAKLLIMALNLVNPTGLLLSDSSITLPSPLPGGESPIRVPMAWGGPCPATPGSAGHQHYSPQSSAPLIRTSPLCLPLPDFIPFSQIFPFLGPFCYPSFFLSPPKQPAPNYFFYMGPSFVSSISKFDGFAITT